LHIVHVDIRVKPESVPRFLDLVATNRIHSLREPGIIAFDLYRDAADPHLFLLFEVYRSPEDHEEHRKTTHFLEFRSQVQDCVDGTYEVRRFTPMFED